MARSHIKREVDLQIIGGWIERGAKVLDLGCGRGVLLEFLRETKDVYGVGVDLDPEKIRRCVRRGVNAYQGDIQEVLGIYGERFFDWVICSRTLHELTDAEEVIGLSLRVGARLAVGFTNYGYWSNRLAVLRTGNRIRNEAFPSTWHQGIPSNSISIRDFEQFCACRRYEIRKCVYLDGDWEEERSLLPNLLAGYALYDIRKAPVG